MNDSQRLDQLENLVRQTRVIHNRHLDPIQRRLEEQSCLIAELQYALLSLTLRLKPELPFKKLLREICGNLEIASPDWKPASHGTLISRLDTSWPLGAAPPQSTPQPDTLKTQTSESSAPPASPTPEPTVGDPTSDSSTPTTTDGPSSDQESQSIFGVGRRQSRE